MRQSHLGVLASSADAIRETVAVAFKVGVVRVVVFELGVVRAGRPLALIVGLIHYLVVVV